MTNIISFGQYFPRIGISKDLIEKSWGEGHSKGIRRIANFDEDSITLAIEAAEVCLNYSPKENIGSFLLASTSFPYQEKQSSTFVAHVCGLRNEVFMADLANSLRAGTTGLILACRQVEKEGQGNSLVVATETRRPYPGSDLETEVADSSVAFVLGQGEGFATIEKSCSFSEEFIDIWRNNGEPFIRNTGDKQYYRQVQLKQITVVITSLLEQIGLTGEEIDYLVLPTSDPRVAKAIASRFNIAFDKIVNVEVNGDMGVCHSLHGLISALRKSVAGSRILVVGIGQGGDGILVRVTDPHLISKIDKQVLDDTKIKVMTSYNKYLRMVKAYDDFKNDVEPLDSIILLNREKFSTWRLQGQKCNICEKVQYPFRHVCWYCHTKDDFEVIELAKTGRIYTYTIGYIFPNINTITPMAVVELDNGPQALFQLADCDISEIEIGKSVQLKMRLLHQAGNYNNYYWKAVITDD